METIEVELSDFTIRRRSLQVSHVAAALSRGLEPGEDVLVHDRVRGHYSARVADIGFEPADTVYRLALGVRLTTQEAHERATGVAAQTAPTLTKQDLLDLLGTLRAGTRTLRVEPRRRDRRTGTR